jgi:hypothetical protein
MLPGVRARAVRMVFEHEREYESQRLLGGRRQGRVLRSSKSPVARSAAEKRRRACEDTRSQTKAARRQLKKQSQKRKLG